MPALVVDIGVSRRLRTRAFRLTGVPPVGMVGQAYSFLPVVTGGAAPYSFGLVGTLPNGLAFSVETGEIFGTPTETSNVDNLLITVTDSLGATTSLTGVSVVVVALAAPANTVVPEISGTPTKDETLSASTGTWSNAPTSYAYQWQRDGVDISGATGSTYDLVMADVGAMITVEVTASNAAGATPATSAAVGPVAAGGIIQSSERLTLLRSQPLGDPIALTGGKNIIVTRAQAFSGRQGWARMRFKFASWFHTLAAVNVDKERPGPQGLTIVGAAIERRTYSTPAYVTAPITFNGGQRSVVLADGDSEVWSDWLNAGWGSPAQNWVENGQFFLRVAIDVGANGQCVRWTNLSASGAPNDERGLLGTSTDAAAIRAIVDGTSSLTAGGFADGVLVNYGYGPILAVGEPTGTVQPDLSIIAQGSSFVEGVGDGGFTGAGTNGGFALRGTWSNGSPARKLPVANYARASGMWSEIADSNTRRERAWQNARILLLDGPTNDINGSVALATIMAKWDKIRGRADAHGLFKILSLVAPRTNAGNTVPFSPNWATGGLRDQVNSALIARWQAGEIDMLIDPNLGRVGMPDYTTWEDRDAGSNTLRVQSASDAQLWLTGTTTDLIHPNATGHGVYTSLLDWALEYVNTNYTTLFP